MKIQTAEFVRSVGVESPLPDSGLPQVSLIGRSNVGKSTLINALARRKIARAGGAPGTTRLLNIYRLVLARRRGELLLIDLPGYGYARGGAESTRIFDRLTERYFRREPAAAGRGGRRLGQGGSPKRGPTVESGARAGEGGSPRRGSTVEPGARADETARAGEGGSSRRGPTGAILLVDARHPGLENDRSAFAWLAGLELPLVVAATKIDRLARSARRTRLRAHEEALAHPVLPVSAKRGDGLPELWTALLALAAGAPLPDAKSRDGTRRNDTVRSSEQDRFHEADPRAS